jgi:hypothetical protein
VINHPQHRAFAESLLSFSPRRSRPQRRASQACAHSFAVLLPERLVVSGDPASFVRAGHVLACRWRFALNDSGITQLDVLVPRGSGLDLDPGEALAIARLALAGLN